MTALVPSRADAISDASEMAVRCSMLMRVVYVDDLLVIYLSVHSRLALPQVERLVDEMMAALTTVLPESEHCVRRY